ncbi:MAG TPA: NADH-quinone oxidoreductase subunit L [Chloroflexi bacterium]|nr:NADH-quinone oxidoreductase subunit L [Chloroflexota bacterium]
MLGLLWLIPILPFAGFAMLALIGGRFSRTRVAIIGAGSIGLAALLTIVVGASFISSPPPGHTYTQTLWTWMQVDGFSPAIAFSLDALSLIMTLVVTFVGFLIHLYSAEFMIDEEGYSRFFAYMNLFVGSMLTLVLADNLLLLYLGWEGVGLCSYFLIGFWYKDPANGRAARKAFVVTRVGDAAMAIGLFLLFTSLGTLQIQELMQRAAQQWAVGSTLAVAAAALLLGGAVGKSAQFPLQTWLPDAMAGPTPVSALIHAATMVTAGVYLIARTHVLFALAPAVLSAVAIIGAFTLLLAGFSALTQSDIKRVLAYSTISQIGYMFLALGVGAWSAAIFHFMTHAFFKALLFLGAGAVSLAMHHDYNMFRLGTLRLRREMPVTFWTFLIGSASLAALPLVTAGFYSKDLILWEAWASPLGGPLLWLAGIGGAFLTAIYTFRMVFLTFFGEAKQEVTHRPGRLILVPLVVLAILSIVGGFVELPAPLGNRPFFSDFLHAALPPAPESVRGSGGTEALFELIAGVVTLVGISLAYLFYVQRRQLPARVVETPLGAALHRFWFAGWGFDWLYATFIVRPYVWLAHADKNDVFDLIYQGIARLSEAFYRILSQTETGRVRWYATGIAIGAVIIVAIAVIL